MSRIATAVRRRSCIFGNSGSQRSLTFEYDPETFWQGSGWHTSKSSRPKIAHLKMFHKNNVHCLLWSKGNYSGTYFEEY